MFRYTVAAGDADADGVSVAANKLALNGGAIVDGANNPAVLTHAALAAQSGHKVDGVAPALSVGDGERRPALVLTYNEALDTNSVPAADGIRGPGGR